MKLNEQITAAIGAHGLWKGRLRAAIKSGKCDTPVDVVRDDHQCTFGKWLYGAEVDAQAKKSPHYQTSTELHRKFHLAAADVISLVLAGKTQDATNALDDGKHFSEISIELTKALLSWKEK